MPPKMRTINEAYRYIKDVDGATALTPHALRALVNSGQIPSVSIGKKKLLNIDALQEYLSGVKTLSVEQEGVVRKVPEKLTRMG